MKQAIVAVVLLVILAGMTLNAQGQPVSSSSPASVSSVVPPFASPVPPAPAVSGRGMAAIKEAGAQEKYLFVLFHDGAAPLPAELQSRFESLLAKEAASAASVVIDRKDPAEKDIVARYEIQRAPMPLVLAIAPNGAVTTGVPAEKFPATTIRDSFVSKGLQTCLASLQEGKLVLLCLQNAKTTANDAATAGVAEFAADPQFRSVTAIVTLDPANPAESVFLQKMRLTWNATEAQTILLAPPAVIIGQFKGAVTKAALQDALQKATSGGGCGSGGCGSGGGCGPSGCN